MTVSLPQSRLIAERGALLERTVAWFDGQPDVLGVFLAGSLAAGTADAWAEQLLDLLLDAMHVLYARGAQLAVLGTGDRELQDAFRREAERYHGQVSMVIGFDEPLSHRMQAGADAIIVPSRFEPCGLTQLYGLRYGTLPVVARVGGLADTVIDANEAATAAGAGALASSPLSPRPGRVTNSGRPSAT
mgnify:CR=1 FL=1